MTGIDADAAMDNVVANVLLRLAIFIIDWLGTVQKDPSHGDVWLKFLFAYKFSDDEMGRLALFAKVLPMAAARDLSPNCPECYYNKNTWMRNRVNELDEIDENMMKEGCNILCGRLHALRALAVAERNESSLGSPYNKLMREYFYTVPFTQTDRKKRVDRLVVKFTFVPKASLVDDPSLDSLSSSVLDTEGWTLVKRSRFPSTSTTAPSTPKQSGVSTPSTPNPAHNFFGPLAMLAHGISAAVPAASSSKDRKKGKESPAYTGANGKTTQTGGGPVKDPWDGPNPNLQNLLPNRRWSTSSKTATAAATSQRKTPQQKWDDERVTARMITTQRKKHPPRRAKRKY